MTRLSNTSAKEIPVGGIKDPAVREAIQLLTRSMQEFAKQASISVNANEPQAPVFTAATYLNGWASFNAAWFDAGYTIDQFGFVHLRGMVAGGAAAVAIFNMPAAYRPTKKCMFSRICDTGISRVDVTTAGDVIQQSGTNVFLSLDGISYSL